MKPFTLQEFHNFCLAKDNRDYKSIYDRYAYLCDEVIHIQSSLHTSSTDEEWDTYDDILNEYNVLVDTYGDMVKSLVTFYSKIC